MAGGGGGSFTLPPPPYDREFNDGLIGDMWASGGVDFGATTPGRVHLASGQGVIIPGLPAYPFRVEAFCSFAQFTDIDTYAAGVGIGPCEIVPFGSPGPKSWGIDIDVDTLGMTCMFDGRWDDFTHQTGHFGWTGGRTYDETAGLRWEIPFWTRYDAHSATDWDAYFSEDGSTWTAYRLGVDPGLTPAGLFIMSYAAVSEWDWVRFT
jgi:hypothetical protein